MGADCGGAVAGNNWSRSDGFDRGFAKMLPFSAVRPGIAIGSLQAFENGNRVEDPRDDRGRGLIARGPGEVMLLRYRIETDQSIDAKAVKGVSPRPSGVPAGGPVNRSDQDSIQKSKGIDFNT